MGATCVLFNPLFDSDAHGYDTRDYNRVDPRLGTKEDFQAVCKALHEAGIRVMLDGVFNHVGRGFWAFRDVQEKSGTAPIKTGSISALTATPAIMTAFGTKHGKAAMSW